MTNTHTRIAVAGSAGDPTTLAHREFAETLTHCGLFDLVLWFPSGRREDKPELTRAEHRLRMAELTFSDEWKRAQPVEFRIDTREVFGPARPTIALLRELESAYKNAEIVFATGVDVLAPHSEWGGDCAVLHFWKDGATLLRDWTFAVLPRAGYPHPRELLAVWNGVPKAVILEQRDTQYSHVSSTLVRQCVQQGGSLAGFVDRSVERYIHAEGLYVRSKSPQRLQRIT